MTNAFTSYVGNSDGNGSWLKRYYFSRAAFSITWVAAAFTLAKSTPGVAATMLILYPAWDAAANVADARRNGGLRSNPTQSLNVFVSSVTTLAVVIALGMSMNAVLAVYGAWATLSGGFQLGTALRRWRRHSAQWAMILSGAQSMLAGVLFVGRSQTAAIPHITDIAPYVAFGAFYFLVSALWLAVTDWRRRAASRTQHVSHASAGYQTFTLKP